MSCEDERYLKRSKILKIKLDNMPKKRLINFSPMCYRKKFTKLLSYKNIIKNIQLE